MSEQECNKEGCSAKAMIVVNVNGTEHHYCIDHWETPLRMLFSNIETKDTTFVTSPVIRRRLDNLNQALCHCENEYDRRSIQDAVTLWDSVLRRRRTSHVTDHGLYWERRPRGLQVNIKQKIVYHSPTGFEIGYGGSGPADLALNILAEFIGGDAVKCYQGRCSTLAMELHQQFKWEFLAGANADHGHIPAETIRKWIEKQIKNDSLDNEI